MFSKFEMVGIGVSVLFMALALYLVRVETSLFSSDSAQQATVAESGVVIVNNDADKRNERANAFMEASDSKGNIKDLIIDDIKQGSGAKVEVGDTVVVHYIGTLQGGQEFDNSRKRGEPFTFTVGNGDVIEGWEKGIVGMKVEGQRILVIPSELGYGDKVAGPIPANSTLVFAIELLEIK